jgi:hypothetical protein
MSLLAEIGLTEGSPAEIVLTTFSFNGRPHASAMGVRARGKSKVVLAVFTNTKTFKNFLRSKVAVINIVKDVEFLVSLALKDLLGFNENTLKFKKSEHVNAPKLEEADAYVEIETEKVEKAKISDEVGSSEVAYITARIKNIEVLNPSVHPFKRSEFFMIESAVLATRIREALKNDRKEAAERLFLELNKYGDKCRRIAPNSRELNLITRIINSLKREMGQ